MRFKLDIKPSRELYEQNRKRIKTKFLWIPKKINREVRWLERASWIQKVDFKVKYYDCGSSVRKYFWQDVSWIDEESRDDELWLED